MHREQRRCTMGWMVLAVWLGLCRPPVSLGAEEETTAAAPAREIRATVMDGRGDPVAGARVVACIRHDETPEATTDASGRAVLRVAADAPLHYVIAVKPQVGLDYVAFRQPGEPASDPYRLPPLSREETEPLRLAFVLNGTADVTVRVVDADGRPLPGVEVSPWYFTKPQKGTMLNFSLREWTFHTAEDGTATLRIIPRDNIGQVVLWTRKDGYSAPERCLFDPQTPAPELTARLVPPVPITGRVTFPDGRPAPQIPVIASGDGYQVDHGSGGTKTRDDGTFELRVEPDMYYLLVAGNDRWASPPYVRVVRAGQPVTDVNLTLQQAIRVHGRVTSGPERRPLADAPVWLFLWPPVDYRSLPEFRQLPNPRDIRTAIIPTIRPATRTDAKGRFEFLVGPGTHELRGPDRAAPVKFVLADQTEYEVNLHAPGPDHAPLSGRVVHQDDPSRGVPSAAVTGVATDHRVRDLRAVSDLEGIFEAERGLSEMIVFATADEGRLAGIVEIGPDDRQVTIPVGPTASARGRLIDGRTQQPLADRQIDYGVRIEGEDGTFSTNFGGSTTTNAQGEFRLPHLAVGWPYVLSLVVTRDADGHPRSWHNVATVAPERPGVVHLGDVVWNGGAMSRADRIALAFQPWRHRTRMRRRDARLGHLRLLVLAGNPRGAAAQQFYDLFSRDTDVRRALSDFVDLPFDTTSRFGIKAAREVGIELEKSAGDGLDFIILIILDEREQPAARTTADKLSTGGRLDPQRLIAFLHEHPVQLPDAEQLLADALDRARREQKRVLIQQSGDDTRCRRLSEYLDDQRALIGKDYIHITLDHRFPHADAVMGRLRPAKDRSVPWMAILDADGRPLVTSDGPRGNIAFPVTPAGRTHFGQMLRQTARRLTTAEIESLLGMLKE